MFNSEHMADVFFIVGLPGESQRVPAHKVTHFSFLALSFPSHSYYEIITYVVPLNVVIKGHFRM